MQPAPLAPGCNPRAASSWGAVLSARRPRPANLQLRRRRLERCHREAWPSWLLAIAHSIRNDPMHIVYHTGTMASLAGVFMKDILYLRLLSLFGTICTLSFWFSRRPVIWGPIFWGTVFGCANLNMIARLLLERTKGLKVSPEKRVLYERHFSKSGVSLRQFLGLMRKAKSISVPARHPLRQASSTSSNLMLLVEGEVDVSWGSKGEVKRVLNGGHARGWLGEMGFLMRLTTRGELPGSQCVAEVTARTPCRLLVWEDAELIKFLDSDVELRRTLILFLADTRFKRMLSRSRSDEYFRLVSAMLDRGDILDSDRDLSSEFRLKHNISPWEHEWVLNQLGWTAKDWMAGRAAEASKEEMAALSQRARLNGPVAPEAGIILFSDYSLDFSELAPYYPASFRDDDGVVWTSLSHYIEAQKHPDDVLRAEIRSVSDPHALRALTKEERFACNVDPDWESSRESAMLRGLNWKFDQRSGCAQVLKSTEGKKLVFNSPADPFWGVGGDGRGKNMLGKLLEQVRSRR